MSLYVSSGIHFGYLIIAEHLVMGFILHGFLPLWQYVLGDYSPVT